MRTVLPATALLLLATTAFAVQFTGVQTNSTTWTYTLTIDPNDNYSVCQNDTTITITNLAGVTGATPPTSTDVPNPGLVATQLAWTAQVLNGGTTVVWTHAGGGSGNFGVPFHISGFTITANAADSQFRPFSTSGFAVDAGCNPPQSRDISGSVLGPVPLCVGNCPPPVPEPPPPTVPALNGRVLAMLAAALAVTAIIVLRRQLL